METSTAGFLYDVAISVFSQMFLFYFFLDDRYCSLVSVLVTVAKKSATLVNCIVCWNFLCEAFYACLHCQKNNCSYTKYIVNVMKKRVVDEITNWQLQQQQYRF